MTSCFPPTLMVVQVSRLQRSRCLSSADRISWRILFGVEVFDILKIRWSLGGSDDRARDQSDGVGVMEVAIFNGRPRSSIEVFVGCPIVQLHDIYSRFLQSRRMPTDR